MKYELIKRLSALTLILAAWMAPGSVRSQILSRGNLFGPGAPPPMVGVEVGFGQHTEQGNLLCDCGSNFTTGTGTGLLGSILFELPLDYSWAVGIKAGIDFKNFSTDGDVNEEVVVVLPNSQNDTAVPMYVHRTGNVKATYLAFAPYVQYQFFRMGPFVQAGLDIGFLIGNNLTQNRSLLTNSVTLADGTVVSDLTFTNGTTTESIQEGPNSNVNTLRLGLLLSAGYNIQVSDRSVFCPLLTYDFPLTTTGNTAISNWKIGSLYATAELKFRLD